MHIHFEDRVRLVEAYELADVAGPPVGGVTIEVLGLHASEADARAAHAGPYVQTKQVIGFRDFEGSCRILPPDPGEMVIRLGLDTTKSQQVQGALSLPIAEV